MLGRRRTASWLSALAAALCMGSVAAPAAAQEQGFALGRLTPSPAGDRMFGIPSPYTAGHLDVHVMLLGDYAHNPLVLVRKPGGADEERLAIVSNQLILHLNGSLALFHKLTINL